MNPIFAIRLMLSTFLANIMVQAVPIPDQSWWDQAEHITLEGAMVVALIVLWKSLQQKDMQLVAATKLVSDALNTSTSSNSELRAVITESVNTHRMLSEEIKLLRMAVSQLSANGG
jgi:hypothetical protein